MLGLFLAVLALFHLSEFAFSAVYTRHELGWHSARPLHNGCGSVAVHLTLGRCSCLVVASPGFLVSKPYAAAMLFAACEYLVEQRLCPGLKVREGGSPGLLTTPALAHSPATTCFDSADVSRSRTCAASWFGVRHSGRDAPQSGAADS